jgi:hypothetical protein
VAILKMFVKTAVISKKLSDKSDIPEKTQSDDQKKEALSPLS